MKKVMFVCHGNICRSPVAEILMKEELKKRGLEKKYGVFSSAISCEEIYLGKGNPIYSPMQGVLKKYQIDFHHNAIQLKKEDYFKYDYFIGMDQKNLTAMETLFHTKEKLYLLHDFDHQRKDVSDPWYTRQFEEVFLEIKGVMKDLIDFLEKD